MKVAFSSYQLIPKQSLNRLQKNFPVKGALLRISENNHHGYVDCLCWPQFGELPFSQIIENIRNGNMNDSLTQRLLQVAKSDLNARKDKVQLLAGIRDLKNHSYVFSYSEESTQVIKVKMSGEFESDKQVILTLLKDKPDVKLRLDFNSGMQELQIDQFIKFLNLHKTHIDFIEDPFSGALSDLNKFSQRTEIGVALDWWPVQIKLEWNGPLILKPLHEDPQLFLNLPNRIIVSSLMDHPLGQVQAASLASHWPNEIHGLRSEVFYNENSYTKTLRQYFSGELDQTTFGYGFGELLEMENWLDI